MSKVEDYRKKMFRVSWEDTEERSTMCEDCLDIQLIRSPHQIVYYFEDRDAERFGDCIDCDVCGHEEDYSLEEE